MAVCRLLYRLIFSQPIAQFDTLPSPLYTLGIIATILVLFICYITFLIVADYNQAFGTSEIASKKPLGNNCFV